VGVSSGGRATREGIEDHRFKGDVFCENDEYINTVIECKVTKNKLLLSELFNNRTLTKWIHQSANESDGYNWILFIKVNRDSIYILTPLTNNNNSIINTQTLYNKIINSEINVCGFMVEAPKILGPLTSVIPIRMDVVR